MSIQNKQIWNKISYIFKVLQQSHSFVTKSLCTFSHNAPLTAKARQQLFSKIIFPNATPNTTVCTV